MGCHPVKGEGSNQNLVIGGGAWSQKVTAASVSSQFYVTVPGYDLPGQSLLYSIYSQGN